MIDATILEAIRRSVRSCIELDQPILRELIAEVDPLVNDQRRIQPRSTTSVSLVAADGGNDGGNNDLRFDPFQVQIIRIVDSNRSECWTEVVSPTTPLLDLNRRHINEAGNPISPLGNMMIGLNVRSLSELSPMIQDVRAGEQRSPSWTQVYRELTEWAALLELLKRDYGSDTLIVFDGLLRSKVFRKTLFLDLGKLFQREIERHRQQRRNVYLVGVAKYSKVIERYRLAMKLSGILRGSYPAYVEVPYAIEAKAYVWSEYARGKRKPTAGKPPSMSSGKCSWLSSENDRATRCGRWMSFGPSVISHQGFLVIL